VRVAFLLFMLFLGPRGLPPPSDFMATLLFTPQGLGLLIVGTLAGGILAALVFSFTAISVPLLMYHRIDAFTAVSLSFRSVVENPRPMALWAALIAGFMILGLATLSVGLIIAVPLIGHATWHAYRALANTA
jgi:uncharacterized membrane protein